MDKGHIIYEGQVLTGSLFNEPMRVETVRNNGNGTWIVGLVGTQSERFRRVTLAAHDLEGLTILEAGFNYNGEGRLLRLGLQAYVLGIAWEFDPYFGLSISRVDPLPHQLEATAMRVVMEYERAQGRQVYDVHKKNLGYDIASLDINSGELRLIEVKGLADATGTILLTPNERRVAEDRRDCYWLYIVTDCNSQPTLQDPVKDPAKFPWREVVKVQHYWINCSELAPDRTRGDHSA